MLRRRDPDSKRQQGELWLADHLERAGRKLLAIEGPAMAPMSPPGYVQSAPSRIDMAYRQWERQIYRFITQHPAGVDRALDVLPGIVTWAMLLLPFLAAWQLPGLPMLLAILFQAYWFYRGIEMLVFGGIGYVRVRFHPTIDWYGRYRVDRAAGKPVLPWREIRHVVIIPNYTEPIHKLRATLEALARQRDVAQQIWVILAMEAKEEGAAEKARSLQLEFRGRLGGIYYTLHPANVPGESAGKAANESFAARWAHQHLVERLRFNPRRITVSSCDADSIFHPRYFTCLTYHFATDPERHYRFWQAPLFYHNNVWDVPTVVRFTTLLMGVWQLAGLTNPYSHNHAVSTYSTSMVLLDAAGYWDPDVVAEDIHIFSKCFYHRHGRVKLAPIYLPVLSDAARSPTFWRTLVNRYEQAKRHALGCRTIPYAIRLYFRYSEIPILTKLPHVWALILEQVLLPMSWFVIALGFAVPSFLNPGFAGSHLGLSLARLFAGIGMVASVLSPVALIIDLLLRPPRPPSKPWWQEVWSCLQWLLLPIVMFFYGALPVLDAQTQVMLGKNAEYRVTEKY